MITMPVEKLVRWAWVEELPKVAPSRTQFIPPRVLHASAGWVCMTGYAGHDGFRLNDFGAVWDPSSTDMPHQDAIIVAATVEALDDLMVVEGDDDYFGAWGEFGRLGQRALHRAWDMVVEASRGLGDVPRPLQGRASAIVVRTCITGTWPEWRGRAPSVVPDVWPNGQPRWMRMVNRAVAWDAEGNPVRFDEVEVDGYNATGKRPYPGAWRAEKLAPDPVPVLAERIRWAMLHLWMTRLAEELDGLGGRRIIGPTRPARPWA